MNPTKSTSTTNAAELIEIAQKLFAHFEPDPTHDVRFFEELIEEFSGSVDVKNQLKQFHAWCLDQHPTVVKNIRFRFRGWLTNTKQYTDTKRPLGNPFPRSAPKV